MDCCLQKNIRTLENAKLVGPVHCYPSLTHSLTNTMDWKSFWGNCRNNPPTKWVAMQIRPRTTRCLPCCFLRHPIFGGDSGASHQLKARGFPQPCIRQKWRVGRRGSPPQGVDRAIGGSRGDTHVWSNISASVPATIEGSHGQCAYFVHSFDSHWDALFHPGCRPADIFERKF